MDLGLMILKLGSTVFKLGPKIFNLGFTISILVFNVKDSNLYYDENHHISAGNGHWDKMIYFDKTNQCFSMEKMFSINFFKLFVMIFQICLFKVLSCLKKLPPGRISAYSRIIYLSWTWWWLPRNSWSNFDLIIGVDIS